MIFIKARPIILYLRRNMGYMQNRSQYWLERIGNREMVGYGMNGQPMYVDCVHFPFPALRYKEMTADLQALFEKQKRDWKSLTLEEKKALYRANYRQTFAEFTAPASGEWMGVVGIGLILCSLATWIYILQRLFMDDPLPRSFSPRYNRAQLRRRILMREDPIRGLAANWDYDRMDWKVKTWLTPDNPFVKCPDD